MEGAKTQVKVKANKLEPSIDLKEQELEVEEIQFSQSKSVSDKQSSVSNVSSKIKTIESVESPSNESFFLSESIQ